MAGGAQPADFDSIASLAVSEALGALENIAAQETASLLDAAARPGVYVDARTDAFADDLAQAHDARTTEGTGPASDDSARLAERRRVLSSGFDALAAFYTWRTRVQALPAHASAARKPLSAHPSEDGQGSVHEVLSAKADSRDDSSTYSGGATPIHASLSDRLARSNVHSEPAHASGTVSMRGGRTMRAQSEPIIFEGSDVLGFDSTEQPHRDEPLHHHQHPGQHAHHATRLSHAESLPAEPRPVAGDGDVDSSAPTTTSVWSPTGARVVTKDPAVLRSLPLSTLPHPLLMGDSAILKPWHVALLAAELPPQIAGYEWHRRYSLTEHGAALPTLLARVGNEHYTLLVIKDENGVVFGGLASEAWVAPRRPGFFGNGQSFVFTFADRRSWDVYRHYALGAEEREETDALAFVHSRASTASTEDSGAETTSVHDSESDAGATTPMAASGGGGAGASSATQEAHAWDAVSPTGSKGRPASTTASAAAAASATVSVLEQLGLSPEPTSAQLDALSCSIGRPPAALMQPLPGGVVPASSPSSEDDAPHFSVYRWTRKNRFFQYSSEATGIGMGGGGGHFAWYLDADLDLGSSGRADTFFSPTLAGAERFRAMMMEAWVFRRRLHFGGDAASQSGSGGASAAAGAGGLASSTFAT